MKVTLSVVATAATLGALCACVGSPASKPKSEFVRYTVGEEPPSKRIVQQPAADPGDAFLSPEERQSKHKGNSKATNGIVVDSKMTRAEALGKNKFPKEFLDRMDVVTVDYLGFDGKHHRGQIVVEKSVALEVAQIFKELHAAKFPIKKVIPIVKYSWQDQTSINDNNTSAFNYRKVIGPGQDETKLSNHSYGRAIDLNPFQNPFVNASGKGPRPYKPGQKGTIAEGDAVTKIFAKHGWEWGGSWTGAKDYQHFSKKSD